MKLNIEAKLIAAFLLLIALSGAIFFTADKNQNAASAEEMASGSEELSSQADQLKDTVSFFNTGHGSYGLSRNSSKERRNVPIVHMSEHTAGNGTPKKAHNGKTGLQLDLSNNDNLDQEFERF